MDKNLEPIATELFGKIRTQFPKIQLGDANSKVTDREKDARFFEFDYIKAGKNLGTVSVNLSEDDGLVVIYSNDITEGQPEAIAKQWFRFLRELREFAKQNMLRFSIRDIAKSNLEKRDYQQLSSSGDMTMTESKLWGTSRTSFQEMGDAKLIVKHSKPVNYDLPAGRTMYIDSIYVENADGERFKYPFKHLNGARALATHVAHGGNSYDPIGQHIIGLSEELNKLRMFKGYVDRNPVVSEAMGSIQTKVYERIDQVKKEIHSLQNANYYTSFTESFVDNEAQEIPEDVVNDWIDRLTIRTFNEELKNVFPYIYKLVGEEVAPVKELTPEDLFSMDMSETQLDPVKEIEELVNFESYLDRIVSEESDLLDTEGEGQSAAIQQLNQLVGQELQAGADGINAIQSLKGLIDDSELMDALKNVGKVNPEMDVRDLIKGFLEKHDEENGTDIASKINFGSTTPEPTAAPAAPEAPAEPAAAEPVPPEAAAAAPAAAPAEQPAAAPVAEADEPPFDGPYKKPGDRKDQFGNTIKTKNMAKHLAKQGMAKAIKTAKKAGATAETIVNFGFGEMSLGEAITKAGFNVTDFFEGADNKQTEIVEFIKSMYDEMTGNFPKGETGVLLAVEKQFGEEAGDLAKHVISELSTVYESKRLRKLAGLNEAWEDDGADDDADSDLTASLPKWAQQQLAAPMKQVKQGMANPQAMAAPKLAPSTQPGVASQPKPTPANAKPNTMKAPAGAAAKPAPAADAFGMGAGAGGAATAQAPSMLDRIKKLAGIGQAPAASAAAPVAGVKPGAAFGDIGSGAQFGNLPPKAAAPKPAAAVAGAGAAAKPAGAGAAAQTPQQQIDAAKAQSLANWKAKNAAQWQQQNPGKTPPKPVTQNVAGDDW